MVTKREKLKSFNIILYSTISCAGLGLYIYLDFEVVVFKVRSTRGGICSSSAERSSSAE